MATVGIDAVVADHGVHALTDRSVSGDPVAHLLEVVGPLDPVEGREVHEDLPIHAKMEQIADVGCDQGVHLVDGQVVGPVEAGNGTRPEFG